MKAIQLAAACALLLPTVTAGQVTASTTLSLAGLAAVRVGNPTADIIEVTVDSPGVR